MHKRSTLYQLTYVFQVTFTYHSAIVIPARHGAIEFSSKTSVTFLTLDPSLIDVLAHMVIPANLPITAVRIAHLHICSTRPMVEVPGTAISNCKEGENEAKEDSLHS